MNYSADIYIAYHLVQYSRPAWGGWGVGEFPSPIIWKIALKWNAHGGISTYEQFTRIQTAPKISSRFPTISQTSASSVFTYNTKFNVMLVIPEFMYICYPTQVKNKTSKLLKTPNTLYSKNSPFDISFEGDARVWAFYNIQLNYIVYSELQYWHYPACCLLHYYSHTREW